MNVVVQQLVNYRPDFVSSFDYHQHHLIFLRYHDLMDAVLIEEILIIGNDLQLMMDQLESKQDIVDDVV